MRCIDRMLFVGEGPLVSKEVFFPWLIAKSAGVDVVFVGTCLFLAGVFFFKFEFRVVLVVGFR